MRLRRSFRINCCYCVEWWIPRNESHTQTQIILLLQSNCVEFGAQVFTSDQKCPSSHTHTHTNTIPKQIYRYIMFSIEMREKWNSKSHKYLVNPHSSVSCIKPTNYKLQTTYSNDIRNRTGSIATLCLHHPCNHYYLDIYTTNDSCIKRDLYKCINRHCWCNSIVHFLLWHRRFSIRWLKI